MDGSQNTLLKRLSNAVLLGGTLGVSAAVLQVLLSLRSRSPNPADANTQRKKLPLQPASVSVQDFSQDEVLSEQLTRNLQFFGADNQQRIAKAFVVVVGLGVRDCLYDKYTQLYSSHVDLLQGVGSHAAHMLLRSGVGKLRLIDYDQVRLYPC